MGTTFTTKQKLEAYFAFKRGWRKAMKDARGRPMTPAEKALLLQTSVREEIFNLPARPSIWGRIWK
jgi:hypothetical protein